MDSAVALLLALACTCTVTAGELQRKGTRGEGMGIAMHARGGVQGRQPSYQPGWMYGRTV